MKSIKIILLLTGIVAAVLLEKFHVKIEPSDRHYLLQGKEVITLAHTNVVKARLKAEQEIQRLQKVAPVEFASYNQAQAEIPVVEEHLSKMEWKTNKARIAMNYACLLLSPIYVIFMLLELIRTLRKRKSTHYGGKELSTVHT